MAQKKINIPEDFWTDTVQPVIVQGDTIPKFIFQIDIDIAGATIKMQLYNESYKVLDVGTDIGGITINNLNQFQIDTIPKEENYLPVGELVGDLEVTFPDNTRSTLFKINMNILKDYTK